MADQAITKQELIDAQKDAQSLDDFINGGDEQIVVTRLLKEYPTLANAIRQIYEKGGKFYPTLAAANADIANIRTDVYVITGDNGAYYKATAGATTLTKSAYDVLLQSKMYTIQTVNKTENHLNNIYTAFLGFLYQYDIDIYRALTAKDNTFQGQHAFNQHVLYQFLNIGSLIRNTQQSNLETTHLYSIITELNKLDALNTSPVGNSFASDMHIPTDKFGVDQGELKGVILKISETTTDFDSLEIESPYIIYDDNLKKYVMVYTAYGQGHSSGIGWATSDDLLTWEKQGQLFSPSGLSENGDQYGTTGPCLYYYQGLYYLYYLGLNGEGYEGRPISICLATSPSLTEPAWTYRGIKIATAGTGWYSQAIFHPYLFTYNGKWWIFFNAEGYDENGFKSERFGFATANSIGGEWVIDPERISQPFEADQVSIQAGDPALFEYDGLIYLFYFSLTSDAAHAVDRWGWTTPSEFPRGWRRGGDLLDNTPSYQSSYAHKPFVVKKDNILYHYYTAVGDQGRCIALKTYDI